MFSHQAEASIFFHQRANGQTLIISLTAEMPAYATNNYNDNCSSIISHSSSSTRAPLPLFFFNLQFECVIVCVHVNMTDLTQPLSSLETQWSHLISHASDALMNQHTPACQQRGVVVKYTGMHFSQNCYLKHGKYSCVLSDKDGASVGFLDEIKQIVFCRFFKM